jgi:hypothetical protein
LVSQERFVRPPAKAFYVSAAVGGAAEFRCIKEQAIFLLNQSIEAESL